jgi:hypothetical protein
LKLSWALQKGAVIRLSKSTRSEVAEELVAARVELKQQFGGADTYGYTFNFNFQFFELIQL